MNTPQRTPSRWRFVSTHALVALVLASVMACSSSTMIRTNVPAKVYIDGAYAGMTPYTMTDTKIVGSSTSIRLEAPGYAPTTALVSRSEKFSVGACIGGVFLLVPFLWIMEYNPDHYYELQAAQTAGPGGQF